MRVALVNQQVAKSVNQLDYLATHDVRLEDGKDISQVVAQAGVLSADQIINAVKIRVLHEVSPRPNSVVDQFRCQREFANVQVSLHLHQIHSLLPDPAELLNEHEQLRVELLQLYHRSLVEQIDFLQALTTHRSLLEVPVVDDVAGDLKM